MKTVLFSKKAAPDPELLTLKAELLAAQGDLAIKLTVYQNQYKHKSMQNSAIKTPMS